MRIDLANLIAAQSSRAAPAKTPPAQASFASELKPAAPQAFEALIVPKAAAAAPTEPPAKADQTREFTPARPRLGSQIDIKV